MYKRQGRHRREQFDLCSDTHCQVYRSPQQYPSRLKIVAEAASVETRGVVITHENQPIQALFHSDCGGHTSDAGTVWGGPTPPYLLAVIDAAVDVHREWRFNIPVDELTGLPLLVRHFTEIKLKDPVVVAVDIGISKRARNLAELLGAPLAIIEKRRVGNSQNAESLNVIGDVSGRTAITFDDETDTGGTLLSAVNALENQGVKAVYACCTHGVFSGPVLDKIDSSNVQELVVTDSLPHIGTTRNTRKISVLSVAPLLGEAIRRIHAGTSVGAMFEEWSAVNEYSPVRDDM